MQQFGIALALLSVFTGVCGTIWSVYSTFTAVDDAEYAGLGPVSETIECAIWFSVGGIVGVALGTALIIVGRKRAQ